MITINNGTPCFLVTGEDTMTSNKTALLIVNYNTFLSTKEGLPQGYIQSFLYNETMNSIMSNIQEDTAAKFVGKDILKVLTNDYVATLKALNPSVTIVSTL
jgi:hypothetical protein